MSQLNTSLIVIEVDLDCVQGHNLQTSIKLGRHMIMIPLPFIFSAIALLMLVREWRSPPSERPNYWFIWFLAAVAFQEVLIGFRFGYGAEWLKQIQPITAAMLPPLAYLSFRNPALCSGLILHMIPVVAVFIILIFYKDLLDTLLAANNLFYAISIMKIGLKGSDALTWVKLDRVRSVLWILWFVFGLLIISGIADALISYDFWTTRGDNTGYIASWASVIGIFAATIASTIAWFWKNKETKRNQSLSNHVQVFEKLRILLEHDPLYLNPDINLNRIAKRLILPARDVSRAINSQTNHNVSQYINALRIKHACQLLSEGELQITQIIYASGFNSKSNFNREFLRVTNKSPSVWRDENKSTR